MRAQEQNEQIEYIDGGPAEDLSRRVFDSSSIFLEGRDELRSQMDGPNKLSGYRRGRIWDRYVWKVWEDAIKSIKSITSIKPSLSIISTKSIKS